MYKCLKRLNEVLKFERIGRSIKFWKEFKIYQSLKGLNEVQKFIMIKRSIQV